MLEALRTFLAHQPIVVLFLTIGLGYLGSKLRIKGIGLGMASVLFVGIAMGAWGKDSFRLPEIISQVGLLLFVYTIGLEAGISWSQHSRVATCQAWLESQSGAARR